MAYLITTIKIEAEATQKQIREEIGRRIYKLAKKANKLGKNLKIFIPTITEEISDPLIEKEIEVKAEDINIKRRLSITYKEVELVLNWIKKNHLLGKIIEKIEMSNLTVNGNIDNIDIENITFD